MATPGKDDVKVRVGGDNKPLKSSLTESRQMIQQFARVGQSALGPFGRQLGNVVSSMFSVRGAIATLAGTGGLGLLINRSIAAADAVGKTASRIGLGVEAYQELKFAAGEAGVGVELFDTAMTALVRRQGEAIAGNKGFAEAFTRIGVSVEELRSLRPEDLLGRVADGVNNLGSQSAKLAALDRVMSEAGRRMVNFTDLGSAGLAKLRQEARDMGLVLDSVMVREAEKAGDQLARVGNIIRTNLTRAVLTLSPQIILMARGFTELLIPALQKFQNMLPDSFASAAQLEAKLATLMERRLQLEAKWEDWFFRLNHPFGGHQNALQGLDDEIADLQERVTSRRAQEKLLADVLESVASPANANLSTKIKDVREELQFEIDQLTRSTAEQRIWSEAKKAGIDNVDALREAIGPLIAEHEALVAAQASAKAAAENAAKAWQDQMASGKAVFDATRTPLEQYQARIAELNDLLDYGAISQETYNRAVLAAQKAYDDAAQKTDMLKIAQGQLADIIRDTGNAALQGNIKSWEDWGQVAVNAIGRVFAAWVELQQAQAASQGGGGGNWLSGLISGVGSFFSLFSGGGNATAFANAGGAIPGASPRFVPGFTPTATGGPRRAGQMLLVGEEGPELFVPKTDGTVLTAPATAAVMGGGGGGQAINIHEAPITINGSNMDPRQLRAVLAEERRKTVAAVAEASRRGGRFSSALG